MMILLPRLDKLAVDLILQDMNEDLHDLQNQSEFKTLPDAVKYSPLGGTIASTDQLKEIRSIVELIATKHGFPSSGSTKSKAIFDRDVTVALSTLQFLNSGEALRDDVWAFISAWLLKEITLWRFGNSPSRFYGGVRNCFQRLWMRQFALDRGQGHADRWGLLQLTEDAMVQIIERPSLGSRPILAQALAEGWLRCAGNVGKGRMEDIMRRAVKGIRIISETRVLTKYRIDALSGLIDAEFQRAAEASIDMT